MRRHRLTSAAALAAAMASFGTTGVAFADGSAATSGNTVATASSSTTSTSTTASTPTTTSIPTTTSSASTTTPTSTTPGATKPGSTKPATKPTKGKSGTRPAAPNPGAAKVTAALFLPDIFVVSKDAVTVPGRLVHVQGVVKPYVAGQVVQVKEFLGRHRFKSDTLRIKPAPGGRSGVFTEKLRSPGTGLARVEVTHPRTREMV